MARRTQDAVLSASERACALFIDRGTTALTVAEIAQQIGLNERTFYRYFSTKQQAVHPVLDWGTRVLAATVRQRTDLSFADAVVTGFALAVDGENRRRTQLLFPLIFRDSALRAVLLQALQDSEDYLRPAVADRLAASVDSIQVRVAAASVLAMIRVALEGLVHEGTDPVSGLQTAMDTLLAGAFGLSAASADERADSRTSRIHQDDSRRRSQ